MNFVAHKKVLSIYQGFALVLLFLLAQYSLASHIHLDEDEHFEVCSSCLVISSTDLDDFIHSSAKVNSYLPFRVHLYLRHDSVFIEDKSLNLQRLRGPPQ